jgi:hypothetical protein
VRADQQSVQGVLRQGAAAGMISMFVTMRCPMNGERQLCWVESRAAEQAFEPTQRASSACLATRQRPVAAGPDQSSRGLVCALSSCLCRPGDLILFEASQLARSERPRAAAEGAQTQPRPARPVAWPAPGRAHCSSSYTLCCERRPHLPQTQPLPAQVRGSGAPATSAASPASGTRNYLGLAPRAHAV